MIYTTLAAFFVMLASLIGVVSVWKHLGDVIERNLSVLVSFSAGVFLLIGYGLTEETFAHAHEPSEALVWIGIGAALIFLIFRILPTFHHHHDAHDATHTHGRLDARRVLFSDALHNAGDGILLAAAFAVSVPFGIATTVSVFIHEIVQEVSEFFVLRQAGYSTARALTINFLVSSTILIGALGGFFLLDTFEMFELPLLGLSAGAIFVVVLYDLVPHSIRSTIRTEQYIRHIIWFIVGALLMFSINTYVGHDHNDAHTHMDEMPHEHLDEDHLHGHDEEHGHN